MPSALVSSVGSRVTGAEAGGLLALLSGKVLGQYDIAPGAEPRLLLVAPNIVAVERELGVVPADFRLWVCLHEETHRVQFTAVPWLRGHVLGEAQALAVRPAAGRVVRSPSGSRTCCVRCPMSCAARAAAWPRSCPRRRSASGWPA